MARRSRIAATIAMVVVGLSLAGCGASGDDKAAPPESTTAPAVPSKAEYLNTANALCAEMNSGAIALSKDYAAKSDHARQRSRRTALRTQTSSSQPSPSLRHCLGPQATRLSWRLRSRRHPNFLLQRETWRRRSSRATKRRLLRSRHLETRLNVGQRCCQCLRTHGPAAVAHPAAPPEPSGVSPRQELVAGGSEAAPLLDCWQPLAAPARSATRTCRGPAYQPVPDRRVGPHRATGWRSPQRGPCRSCPST